MSAQTLVSTALPSLPEGSGTLMEFLQGFVYDGPLVTFPEPLDGDIEPPADLGDLGSHLPELPEDPIGPGAETPPARPDPPAAPGHCRAAYSFQRTLAGASAHSFHTVWLDEYEHDAKSAECFPTNGATGVCGGGFGKYRLPLDAPAPAPATPTTRKRKTARAPEPGPEAPVAARVKRRYCRTPPMPESELEAPAGGARFEKPSHIPCQCDLAMYWKCQGTCWDSCGVAR